MKNHKCKQDHSCICYQLALEPDEDCPVHGYPWPPRCGTCGRFMKWEIPFNGDKLVVTVQSYLNTYGHPWPPIDE